MSRTSGRGGARGRGGRPNRAGSSTGMTARGSGRGRRGGHQAARAPPPPPAQQPQPSSVLTEAAILKHGLCFVGFPSERQNVRLSFNRDRFRAFYGVSPKAVQAVIKDLAEIDLSFPLSDFLMALNWLRLYDNEHVLAGRWALSEDTIRNRIRDCCKGIVSLKGKKIKWIDYDDKTVFVASVDGTHCRIYEPRTDPGSKWFSHKFNGPGVSYELAISLWSNDVVSIRGPFPASMHDITIFRGGKKDEFPKDPQALIFKIKDTQRVVGDSGYEGEPDKVGITRQGDSKEAKAFKARAKSRHESFNSRLKAFQILDLPFRHGFDKHQTAFDSVCILCQYDIENGHGLMEM